MDSHIANNLTVTIQYSETTSGLASSSASSSNVSLTDYKLALAQQHLPEPTTFGLMLLGAVTLLCMRRRTSHVK